MNNLRSNRKLLIFTSVFLLIVSSFVVADFISSTSSFSFPGEPGDDISQTFNLENTYPNYTIESIEWDFVPDTNIQGNNVDNLNFNFVSFPSMLIGNESHDSPLIFTIPEGFDAVDEDLESITWNIGYLVVNGTATNNGEEFPVVLSSDIKIQVENHFEFYNVEFEINREDPKNISNGVVKTVQDGDTIKLKVIYENSFENETLKFDDDDIEAILIVDGNVIVREDGRNIVEGGEIGELEVEFDVDDYDVGEKYPVEIRLEGLTTAGGRHGEIFEFEIEVEEETVVLDVVLDSDGDGVNDDLDLCPDTNILCISDEAGCEMDPDNDGICNGVDRTPNGEVKEEEQINQNTISKQNEEDAEEPKEVEEKVVKKNNEGGETGSFFFGLIVGFIGAALFFTLTKV